MSDIHLLYIRTTKNCNAKCFMCDFWKHNSGYISEEGINNCIEFIKKNNIRMARFTGGEPLLYKNLETNIKTISDLGVKTSIITNGLLLPKKLKELADSGLNQIIISLDASEAQLHNKIRNTEKLYENIISSLNLLNSNYPNINVRVNTVVSHKNIYDLPNMVELLDKYHVNQWSIIPIKSKNYLWKDYISAKDFIEYYLQFKENVKESSVEMMGYSNEWAYNIIDKNNQKWTVDSRIKPKDKCHIAKMIAFYEPFENKFYPCNCVPHRLKIQQEFNYKTSSEWFYNNGSLYCEGCEPLNAYCSDHPEKIIENIFQI